MYVFTKLNETLAVHRFKRIVTEHHRITKIAFVVNDTRENYRKSKGRMCAQQLKS